MPLSPGPSPRIRADHGQVVPLAAVALLFAALLGLGLVQVAVGASRRAAAAAAADASALAGAAEGREAAADVAAANGARLVGYQERGFDVSVEVERRGVRARARARWVPDEGTAPGGGRGPGGG